MAFKKGDLVKLNITVPQGAITKMRMDDDGTVFYLVAWQNADGSENERWFTEEQLVIAE